MGGAARPHLLRDQLPQPRRVDARPGLRGLPQAGSARRRAGGARDHRRRRGQHAVGVPRRHARRDRAGAQRRASATARSSPRRSSTRTPTSAPGRARRLHRRGHHRRPREARWPRRATSTPTRWRTPSTRCGPTTWSSVRRQQLAARQEAAGLRPAGVEQGQHPDAGQDALASTCGRATSATSSPRASSMVDGEQARPGQGRRGHLRAVRGRRPHRPVDLRLQDHPAARRPQPVRAQHVGPHRRHRQPAQPQGEALDQRGQPAGRSAGVEGGRRRCTRAPGGRTGPPGSTARAARWSPPRASSAARSTPRSSPRPGATCATAEPATTVRRRRRSAAGHSTHSTEGSNTDA